MIRLQLKIILHVVISVPISVMLNNLILLSTEVFFYFISRPQSSKETSFSIAYKSLAESSTYDETTLTASNECGCIYLYVDLYWHDDLHMLDHFAFIVLILLMENTLPYLSCKVQLQKQGWPRSDVGGNIDSWIAKITYKAQACFSILKIFCSCQLSATGTY